MSEFATPKALGRLYHTTFNWLLENGNGIPATGVEPTLAPDGLPIVHNQAQYAVELAGNEVRGVAPKAAQKLGMEEGDASLAVSALEGAYEPLSGGKLGWLPAMVEFSVTHPEENPIAETSYQIWLMPEGLRSATVHVLTGLERELEIIKYGDRGAARATPESLVEGIEEDHRWALRSVVDALHHHWPEIKAARETQA